MTTTTPVEERFWRHVNLDDGCWEWGGAIRNGYGVIGGPNRSTIYAHRLSFEMHNGPIGDGLFVCHRCDNKKCVRPDHLFVGTHQDNMTDAARKGRMRGGTALGTRHHCAKLTDDDVIEIRRRLAAGTSQMDIARDYGLHQSSVWAIHHRKTWTHI